jgi:hypothetical protein
MAKKKTEEQAPEAEGALATVAKAVGKAAGKVAKLAGSADAPAAEAPPAPPTPPAKVKVPKLAPKNKSRLPRKEKKALQKKNAARKA